MKRLLCIVGGMNVGGAETFLMKVYRNIDRTKYQFDFAVSIQDEGYYDKEIQSLGGNIYHVANKSNGLIKSFCSLRALVKKHKYKYVLRTSQHSLSAIELIAAKSGGAKVCVFRSSNSHTGGGRNAQLLHMLFRFLPRLCTEIRISPSIEAANFMYGERFVKKRKVELLNNGIDLDFYKFSKTARERIRSEFNISQDTILIGHIGRFNWQKNHSRLLSIFYEYHKINNNSKLILLGKGELDEIIHQLVNKYNLTADVIFAGIRPDVPDILSSIDLMLFPSHFEGMPNSIIEAQANGVPCLISDTISKDVRIIDTLNFSSLGDDDSMWCERIMASLENGRNCNIKDSFKSKGYDIKDITTKFVNLIFNHDFN